MAKFSLTSIKFILETHGYFPTLDFVKDNFHIIKFITIDNKKNDSFIFSKDYHSILSSDRNNSKNEQVLLYYDTDTCKVIGSTINLWCLIDKIIRYLEENKNVNKTQRVPT